MYALDEASLHIEDSWPSHPISLNFPSWREGSVRPYGIEVAKKQDRRMGCPPVQERTSFDQIDFAGTTESGKELSAGLLDHSIYRLEVVGG